MPDLRGHSPPVTRVPAPRVGPNEARLRVVHVYKAADRPAVLVEVSGEWYPGELRKWSRDVEGAWWAGITWGRREGMRFLDTFPADQVWEDGDSLHRRHSVTNGPTSAPD